MWNWLNDKGKMVTWGLVAVNLVLIYLFVLAPEGWFVQGIKVEVDRKMRIEAIERRVIEKLKMVREAEIAYKSRFGFYTGSWDKLIDFIKDGELYITSRRENIITLDYGADSVQVFIDTLGTVSVMDSLFRDRRGVNFDMLYVIPETGARFDLWVGNVVKGEVVLEVIEVKDTAPVNPDRHERSEIRARKPLRFGDREEVTTSGNWE